MKLEDFMQSPQPGKSMQDYEKKLEIAYKMKDVNQVRELKHILNNFKAWEPK